MEDQLQRDKQNNTEIVRRHAKRRADTITGKNTVLESIF